MLGRASGARVARGEERRGVEGVGEGSGESGFCPQHGPQGELWQRVVGKGMATALPKV